MQVGGIYFINYKTKDCFLEGAGLSNLSMSTLKERMSHDWQLFFVIYILIEKIVTDNTHPSHDVPGTSLEGLLKVIKSETCRGLSEDSRGNNTKIDDFMKNQ